MLFFRDWVVIDKRMPSLILKVTGNFAYSLQIETEINAFPF